MNTPDLLEIVKQLNMYSIATSYPDEKKQTYYLTQIQTLFDQMDIPHKENFHSQIIKSVKTQNKTLYCETYLDIVWVLLRS